MATFQASLGCHPLTDLNVEMVKTHRAAQQSQLSPARIGRLLDQARRDLETPGNRALLETHARERQGECYLGPILEQKRMQYLLSANNAQYK